MRGFVGLALSLSGESETATGGNGMCFAHHLYYKKQTAKPKAAVSWDGEEEEDTSKRTIFVVNIPPNFDYSDVMEVLRCFGEVDSVVFHESQDAQHHIPGVLTSEVSRTVGCQRADVIFASEDGVTRALEQPIDGTRQPYQEASKPSGKTKWLQQYHAHRPKSDTLQMQVDRFMEAFDQRKQQEKAAASGPLVDEDGWTTVRYASKRRRLLLPKGVEKQTKKQKKGDKPLLNFYKHQQMDRKRNQLAELRQKFEEDKRRLSMQTATRKFKPF